MDTLKTGILNGLQNLKGSGKFTAIGSLPFTPPGYASNPEKIALLNL